MSHQIPKEMKALVLHSYEKGIEGIRLESRPMPSLGPSDVLVKMSTSPINPSDLMFIQGLYGFKKPLPVVPGFEGSGKVVAAGSNLMARFLLGKRVSCASQEQGDGTWAEYMKVPALTCLPLPREITDEQGAMMFVNPFTAWALVDQAKKEKVKAFVQTAAGSQLGRMIWRLAEENKVSSIGIVRRKEQQKELTQLGMKNVLCSADPNFKEELRELSDRLGATLAFDAVAGEMTEALMSSMPWGSRIVLYGGLSLEEPKVSIHSLIFEGKKLEGFWLSTWFRGKSLLALLNI